MVCIHGSIKPFRPGVLGPGKARGGTKCPDLKKCQKHFLGHLNSMKMYVPLRHTEMYFNIFWRGVMGGETYFMTRLGREGK